jgi:HPt (histidine-containing phosphotransfer) domain-containing protein
LAEEGGEDSCPPELIRKYLDRRKVEMEKALQALEDRESSALREILHRWKGNAALYGLPELGRLAGEVVTQLDQECDGSASDTQWENIRSGVLRVEACLTKECESRV